jgi:hypothetical protein
MHENFENEGMSKSLLEVKKSGEFLDLPPFTKIGCIEKIFN